MKKLMLAVALAIGAAGLTPQPVAAEADCSNEYVKCLNDSHELTGLLQTLADIECFSDYTACLIKSYN